MAVRTLNQLPPELLDHIFSFTNHEDAKSCSVVCREWACLTFPRVYERMRIVKDHTDTAAFELFVVSGHLFPFVKQLSLRSCGDGGLDIVTLGQLLTRLPNLRSLQLYAESLFYSPHRHSDLL